MVMLLQGFKVLYLGRLWQKSWVAPTPPTRVFGIQRLVTTQNFENFWCQSFFRGRWVEKMFLPKDAYRVTWLGRKKLGHCTWTTWVRNRKRQQMRIFDHFSPNPQIGFLAILGVRRSGWKIWGEISYNLGYMPLKYLWLTPKTSKDIQSQSWDVFFSVTVFNNYIIIFSALASALFLKTSSFCHHFINMWTRVFIAK